MTSGRGSRGRRSSTLPGFTIRGVDDGVNDGTPVAAAAVRFIGGYEVDGCIDGIRAYPAMYAAACVITSVLCGLENCDVGHGTAGQSPMSRLRPCSEALSSDHGLRTDG